MSQQKLTLVLIGVLAAILTPHVHAQSWLEPTFYLYTRANRGANEVLKYNSESSIQASLFNGALPTKVITHGYFDGTSRGEWMAEMANKMLDYEGEKTYSKDFINDYFNSTENFFSYLKTHRCQCNRRRLELGKPRLLLGGSRKRQNCRCYGRPRGGAAVQDKQRYSRLVSPARSLARRTPGGICWQVPKGKPRSNYGPRPCWA